MYLAYLDAGSGSQLAMAIVAGFAGAMVVVKVWWRRALTGVRRVFGRSGGQQSVEVEAPARSESDG